MLSKLIKFLWGDISREELKKFCLLGLGLLFTLMAYWMLRPIKDALFISLVGKSLLPYAKMISLAALVIILMQYSKLVDMFEKHRLVYFINSIISLFLCTIAIIIIQSPDMYLQPSFASKIIGWTAFIGSECSLIILYSLVWSYIASSMDTATAKKGYPLIIIGAKLGAMAGSLLMLKSKIIGIGGLLIIAAGCISGTAILIKIFTCIYSSAQNDALEIEKNQTGALEGLRLLLKHPYLIGIFIISFLPDVIGEILNISMLFLADKNFHTPEQIAAFLGTFGVLANATTLIFALFGTGLFLRIWGFRAWLLLYPLITAILVMYTWIFYDLWAVVIALALLKGLRYAIDQPCREIMFIPTSTDIQFKTRSWMCAFRTRAGQGMGAGLSAIFSSIGGIALLGIIGLWLPAAWYVRKENKKLIQSGQILR